MLLMLTLWPLQKDNPRMVLVETNNILTIRDAGNHPPASRITFNAPLQNLPEHKNQVDVCEDLTTIFELSKRSQWIAVDRP